MDGYGGSRARCDVRACAELNAALIAYLSQITEKVIREEVHKETGEAEEVDEPTRIGR